MAQTFKKFEKWPHLRIGLPDWHKIWHGEAIQTGSAGKLSNFLKSSMVQPVIGTKSLSCTTQASPSSSAAEETDVGS